MKKFLLTAVAILFAVLSANAQFITSSSKSRRTSYSGDIAWRGEFNVGMAIGKMKNDKGDKLDGTMFAPVLTGTYGVKLNDYLFLGAGTGFKYVTQNFKVSNVESYGSSADISEDDVTISSLMMPLFAEIKVFFPVDETITPFIMADFGYSLALFGDLKDNRKGIHYSQYSGYTPEPYSEVSRSDIGGGLCYKFCAGVVIHAFTLGLGYDYQAFSIDKTNINCYSSAFFFSVGYVFKE